MNMRTIKHILIGAAAILALACSKESKEEQPVNAQAKTRLTVFYADLGSADATRTYIDEAIKIHWNNGDLVSIFQTTSNDKFRFTGEDGARSGEFEEAGNTSCTGEEIGNIYSVYPYSESTSLTTDEVLSVHLPETQGYAPKSFGQGANTMVCRTQSDKLSYKNVGGYLVIKLYGNDVEVASVSVKANNGEAIAGDATISFDDNGVPAVTMPQGIDEITVSSETPVTLGSSSTDYTEFWFVVPPVTLAGGFTVTVNGANGKKCEKVSTKQRTITRNGVMTMTPFEVVLTGDNQISDGEEQDGGDY